MCGMVRAYPSTADHCVRRSACVQPLCPHRHERWGEWVRALTVRSCNSKGRVLRCHDRPPVPTKKAGACVDKVGLDTVASGKEVMRGHSNTREDQYAAARRGSHNQFNRLFNHKGTYRFIGLSVRQ